MGLKNYFKAGKGDAEKKPEAPANEMSEISEKPLAPPRQTHSGLSTPRNGLLSSGASIAPSTRSGFMDDIKHEVMVNYLFQQQCARLWVGDGSGEVEGVLLRKFKGSYLACPPSLSTSTFAMACAALNVPVSTLSFPDS
jgi:hypothetical protein